MIAERLIEALHRITGETIESAWEIFDPCWGTGEPADDRGCDLDNDEHWKFVNVHGLMDL
jgi:hypothetical protein